MATPNIAQVLDPFEKAVAGKNSSDKFDWTYLLESAFRK